MENSAEAHWGYGENEKEAVITARVNEEYVNWKETFELNIMQTTGDEDEIRLFKNTPLEIISITIEDEEIDLELLGNKTFIT